MEISWGELTAIRDALATDHASPICDELHAALNFYFQNLPGPGESEEDLKAAEEAEKSGLDQAPASDQQPLNKADDLLPAPAEEETGEQGLENGEEGDNLPPEDEIEEPPPAPEEEEEPEHEHPRHFDHEERIPAPPRE